MSFIFRIWILAFAIGLTLAIDCGVPGNPSNGSVIDLRGSYSVKDRVTYVCGLGLGIPDNNTRTCNQSGRWWPPMVPHCDFNTAFRKPVLPPGGDVIADGDYKTCVSVNGIQNFTVVLGRAEPFVSGIAIVLGKALSYDYNILIIKDVANPAGQISHNCGRIRGTTNETTRIYIPCNSSHWMVGEQITSVTIENFNRNASDIFSICEVETFDSHQLNNYKRCGIPDLPKDGTVKEINETEMQFVCNDKFLLSGPNVTRCTNGKWDNVMPECTGKPGKVIAEIEKSSNGVSVPQVSALLIVSVLGIFCL